jgi:hypothetical protein
MRWPFSPKIHPVLPENVKASKLPSEELDRQAGDIGLKLLREVALTWELSGRIREQLAHGAIKELRGRDP